jgi:hypothetical protein
MLGSYRRNSKFQVHNLRLTLFSGDQSQDLPPLVRKDMDVTEDERI